MQCHQFPTLSNSTLERVMNVFELWLIGGMCWSLLQASAYSVTVQYLQRLQSGEPVKLVKFNWRRFHNLSRKSNARLGRITLRNPCPLRRSRCSTLPWIRSKNINWSFLYYPPSSTHECLMGIGFMSKVAGIVEAVGEEVVNPDSIAIGDKVVVYPYEGIPHG